MNVFLTILALTLVSQSDNVTVTQKAETLHVSPTDTIPNVSQSDTIHVTASHVPSILAAPEDDDVATDRLISVKTNIIPWGAAIMNIGGEISVSDNISVSLPVWYCPWFIADRRALRILALQPEARWWFSTPGQGHFAGVHASVAWYNLKFNDYRYQDRGRPLLGAGVTYGYSLKFNRHWGMEFSIGAGYFNLRYDRFFNTPNGRLHDTRQTSYLGIDHLSVSLVYDFSRH